METYNTTVRWFSRHDKENYPKEDCEVLLWQKNPSGYATVKGQFIVDEYNSDDELIEEAMFFLLKIHTV